MPVAVLALMLSPPPQRLSLAHLGAGQLCVLLALAGCAGGEIAVDGFRDKADEEECAPAADQLRLMSFNIQHAATGLPMIADTIRAHQPDIVGLQEVDNKMTRSNFVHQTSELAELTGMQHYVFLKTLETEPGEFGQTEMVGEYGLAVLSRYPLTSWEVTDLPGDGESRVLVDVEFQLPAGQVLRGAFTHLHYAPAARQAQAREINQMMAKRAASRRPTFIMGDFNATPDSATYDQLQCGDSATACEEMYDDGWRKAGRDDTDGYTYFERDGDAEPDKRIDYIWLERSVPTPRCAYVAPAVVSDHAPLVMVLPAAASTGTLSNDSD